MHYLYHVLDVDNSNNNFHILYSLNPLKDDLKNYLLKINMNGEIENCYHIDKQIERFLDTVPKSVSNPIKNIV
jgi:hypothetical protein